MVPVAFKNVTKQFSDTTVVVDLTFEITTGETVCVLGPNGAGKSTTFGLLLGALKPSSGTVAVFGNDPFDEPSVRSRLGALPDGFDVYPRLTGRQHVQYAARLNGDDRDPARLLDRVGLAAAIDKRAGKYSLGMKRRLGLALALSGDPDLLVLDEPSAGLDPVGSYMLRDIIREEQDRGTTILVASHNLEYIDDLCDRFIAILDGRVQFNDTVAALREQAGTGIRVSISVEACPDPFVERIATMTGVSNVKIDSSRIRIDCTPSAKPSVIAALDDSNVRFTDIDIEEQSTMSAFRQFLHEGTQ
ncbi:ABC transporter ATP-binding protein [Natrinema salaciae]|uniref:ABC-2 type transport system ATP-binding protein n=1 Tax=Natrinema salaciae TaxID=1186196 RepID=A0A1H9LQG2_9EURY|nr:ABC transporter ATP-binding protein [Natrinema salaciae]SER13113.1 ABC-2 type transport system ATP-binding protein [Natrinema salaciae]